jgi:3-hydroxybutyryl-CoA dehydrogenase
MQKLGVIGSGIMGAGIAQVAAASDWSVILLDVSPEVARNALTGIEAQLDRLVQKGKLSLERRDQIRQHLGVAEAPRQFADCDLIIEAVAEKLDVKIAALQNIKMHNPKAIIASNTSSLSIGAIGRGIAEPHRTIGLHFFNPVPLMSLVEVITPAEADPALATQAGQWVTGWGKTAVRAKDTPGFIVNRVARGYYLEALRLLGEGVMSLDGIDATMRIMGGFRMGPFELMDLVGIDVNFTVSTSVWEQMGRPARLQPHPIQEELYRNGKLGRKTGSGFYSYQAQAAQPTVQRETHPLNLPSGALQAVSDFAEHGASTPGTSAENYVFARILGAIINEACLARDEGVATASDIDTAMRLGTNYPHGPLEWADRIGLERVRRLLNELNSLVADGRYAPASSLTRL